MNLPPLPSPNVEAYHYDKYQMYDYGKQCRDNLIELVKAVHKAKGRYHSQIAMCDLYDSCGLPNQRPVK